MTVRLSGLVLLDKPGGISSFNALKTIKKTSCCEKVGHAGTLDRFAEGLLVVLVGDFTKLVPYFVELEKVYEAEITFGKETDTLDPEGKIVRETPVPTLAEVKKVLPSFLGKIEQVPPKYSALHIGGRRAHQLVREGQIFEMQPREVTIYDLQIISFESPRLRLLIRCSKGTYIRSLARDIGLKADSCGYVSSLKRTKIGPYHSDQAVSPEKFDPEQHVMKERAVFDHLDFIKTLNVTDESALKLMKGKHIAHDFFNKPLHHDGLYALFTHENSFVALIEKMNGSYSYKFVRADKG